MLLETLCVPYRKARLVNQTSASFVSKQTTATKPTLDDASSATAQVAFELGGDYSAVAQNGVRIIPYAIGTNDQTFSMRVYVWDLFPGTPNTFTWHPTLLCEVLCTLDDTLVGLAGKNIIATEMFCDTIAIVGTSGNVNVSFEIVSPADGVNRAHIVVDAKGGQVLEMTFSTGSSATSCNALWKPL